MAHRLHIIAPVFARTLSLVALTTACNAHPLADVDYVTASEEHGMWAWREWPKVDVLVIVDDSASMAAEAPAVWSAVVGLVDVALPFDLRVGVTTTSADGRLIATSCRERLNAFVTAGDVDGVEADVRVDACLLVCDHHALALPSPWIDHRPDRTNLPPGVTFDEAAACVLPQGVSGSVFESPLQSMRRVVQRSSDPDVPEYGFLRRGATLVVAFITDEDDCSVAPEHAAEFASLPQTSAACRHDELLEDLDGYEVVLRREQELSRQADPRAEVMVVSIVGDDDGCADSPLRLLDFADRFSSPWRRESVCSPHFSAIHQLFAHCGTPFRPHCIPTCISDPSSCELEHRQGDATQWIPRCDEEPEATTCWIPRIGDERASECVEHGGNVEAQLFGTELWSGGGLWWRCEVSDDADVDCPGLQ